MTLLQVRGLSRHFGGVAAVNDLGFDLSAGQMLALIGPNGAGKSTVFNMIGGQLKPSAGSIRFNGLELAGRTARAVARLGVGRTFQIAATFATLTVAENVQMALLARHRGIYSMLSVARSRYRGEALELLVQVGMRAHADRPCNELAYGDIKRVELATALAGDPSLLLMDEPTAGMAPGERHALMQLTQSLVRERGLAVLFTEHSMDVVFAYADRALVLARGARIAEGTPAAVRDDPAVKTVYLGSGLAGRDEPTVPGPGKPDAPAWDEPDAIAPNEPGARVRCEPAASPGPLLRVRGLSGWYGGARILRDVNIEVGRGEVVALMGRNGAGKSTTLKAIMGLLARRAGQVEFMGRDIAGLAPFEIARAGVGFVPEDRRVFGELTVLENLSAGRLPARTWPDGVAAPVWTPQRLFELFPNLGEMPDRPGALMSGGEQQMLTVARTLMGNPLLLLLDEPSEGVSPLIVEQMAHMILRLKAQGVGILLSEQNMAFAQWVADRAVILQTGSVSYDGSMADLRANPALQQTFLSV